MCLGHLSSRWRRLVRYLAQGHSKRTCRWNDAADKLARWGALLTPSAIPCSLFPFTSCIQSSLFSDWRRTISLKLFGTQVFSISTEELVLPRHACYVLSRLRCNGHSLLLRAYLSRIEASRILPAAPADTHPRIPLISFCTVQLRTFCTACSLATLCLFTTSGQGLGKLPGFWGSMVIAMPPSLGRGRVTTTTTCGLFSTTSPKCRALSREKVKTIF